MDPSFSAGWMIVGLLAVSSGILALATLALAITLGVARWLGRRAHRRTRDMPPEVGDVWMTNTGEALYVTQITAQGVQIVSRAMAVKVTRTEWRQLVLDRRMFLMSRLGDDGQ